MKHASWIACVVALALVSAPAFAQEGAAPEAEGESETTVRARGHFQKGVDYYTEGDLTAAMVEFKRAYELEPSFRLLYNLAQVAYEQRDYALAEQYFRSYLAEGKTQIEIERRIEVEQELERLKGRVADIFVSTNIGGAELFIDDRPVGREPLQEAVRVSAGRRRVRAELAGHAPATEVIEVVGGEPQRVELRFASPVVSYAEPPSEGGSSAALWTGIATGVLAVGTAGMAVWTASEQASYDDAVARETSRRELDDLSESTEQKALITDVLLGATVVAGAITVILLLVDDGPEERAGIKIGPGAVRGTF